ncbi:MAG: alpha/beta hydrolase [Albidovulum sp.]|nr:alpha/beta hydrolase [Albidovulum sp.]MDE0306764.1 alpha/beta hydrolase [Albidovulum sp.]MDE0532887.1 alpha/beta hydrolase [Albidovulum sp.]
MGQTIYGNYDQESLDLEYDMRRRCPHYAETFASFGKLNDRMVSNFQCSVDVSFGDSDGQKLDIWHGRGNSPILLFIHGGYWRAFEKDMFRFVAERFVESGAAVVLNDYDLCPTVTMTEIVRQNRAAVAWIYKNAGMIGGDPGRIHVTGHSAGGHLTAMLLATNWQSFGLPYDTINGAVPLSGLFDLEPIRLSYLNADLRMNEEEARQQSPINNLPDRMPPTVVAVGGGETDEFRRQSRIYTDACRKKGFEVSYLEVGNCDHVMVSGEYRNLLSPLTAALMTQMGL